MRVEEAYFKRDFWTTENLKYSEPHFRLQKLSTLITRLARGRHCDLLDVGCGPAALAHLLPDNVRYRGIDIAIHGDAAGLREVDFVENEIGWDGERFDMVVASGVFEYVGAAQNRKFDEIRRLLKPGGLFVVSYINFEHLHRVISPLYNNIRPAADFARNLKQFFDIQRHFPSSYNWQGTPPRRRWLRRTMMGVNVNLPVMSRLFAVEYLFVGSPREAVSR